MENIVSIELDPIKDGIMVEVEKKESTAGKFIVMGTNYEHRIISDVEFFKYIEALGNHSVQVSIGDYILIFDKRKVIEISGDGYFVGSFLIAKPIGNGDFVRFSDDGIEGIKEDICDYFSEVIINGERFDALEV